MSFDERTKSGRGRPRTFGPDIHRWLRFWLPVALLSILLLLVAVSLVPLAPAHAVSYDQEELNFLRLLNDYREANGRQPLLLSDQLSGTAERHARDMGTYGFFSHVSERSAYYPAGSRFGERLTQDGYPQGAAIAENLAAGMATGQAVFDSWKASSGHNANMLGSGGSGTGFRAIGIARVEVAGSPYRWYWTTEFGSYADATAHDPFAFSGSSGGSAGGSTGGSRTYSDIPFGYPYASAIEELSIDGIIHGYGDSTFGPERMVRRQQFAKMMVGSLELPVSESDAVSFGDVAIGGPGTLYPDNYIAVAAAHGITNGTDQQHFSPTLPISRAQVVTMAVRAVQAVDRGALLSTAPGDPGPWGLFSHVHGPNAALAEVNGLLDGILVERLDPWASMPRGEVAQILFNMRAVLGL